MVASYSSGLVALSVLIAILASYTALDLASRIAQSAGRATYYWLFGGAFSMGVGIWSMHFIGMLAFSLPIPLAYDVPITLASVLPAVAASGLALFNFSRRTVNLRTLSVSAVLMGGGIVAMHYTGMAAMRMQPPIRYDPALFSLSVVIAIVASAAALWIARFFLSAGLKAKEIGGKMGSAVVMGFAIAGMHYTGMAAANFAPDSVCLATQLGVDDNALGILVATATLVILVVTLMLSIFDARLAGQAQGMLAQLAAGNKELQESEYRLALALEASGLAVWDYDLVTGDVRLSRHWWPILGYEPSDVPLRIEAWEKLTHPDDVGLLKAKLAMHLKGAVPTLDAEYRMLAKSGEWRWIRTVGRVVERDAAGRALRATGTHGDITLRKEQEGRIARLSRIHALLSGVNSAIARIRDRGELLNEACRIAVEHGRFGFAWVGALDPATLDVTPATWAGEGSDALSRIKLSASNDTPQGQGKVGQAIRERRPVFSNDIGAEAGAGGPRREEALRLGFRSVIALPLFEGDTVAGSLAMYAKEPNFFNEEEVKLLTELARDISYALDHIAKEEKLNYLAYYDALTGAANRDLLNDRLAQALAQAHRSGEIVAVALLDLDQFKLVNESLGHEVGDQLLRMTAVRLRSCVRDSDTLARFAGDQFVLVLPGQTEALSASKVVTRISEAISTAPQIVEILQRALSSIAEPMTAGDRELRLTCSIGVSLYPQDGQDGEALLRNAGAALSRAKQLGRKNFQFYTAELNARIEERLSLRSSLRGALERDEFVLYYQPKTNLQTGQVSGAEALLRWNKPGEGMVSPGEIIPVLEETGLIIDVGRWAMEKAASEYRQWQAAHPQPPRIAVNVSQLQLAQKDFAAVVESILRDNECGSIGLDIEITESLIMQDLDATIPKLRAIREMGVKIAIDDFGTGYSSLSQLAKLPVDTLKIDQVFIRNMETSPDGMTIVTTIISLAHSLGLKVVAEGVETEGQNKILRLLKCNEIQGYLVSPPLPAERFKEWWDQFPAKQPARR
ncbi:MAG: EAL domain-containing protein [Betaproteobacteria bacterium]|nr:EAL domain-containing protein [Betaproteobacteria bacterium]